MWQEQQEQYLYTVCSTRPWQLRKHRTQWCPTVLPTNRQQNKGASRIIHMALQIYGTSPTKKKNRCCDCCAANAWIMYCMFFWCFWSCSMQYCTYPFSEIGGGPVPTFWAWKCNNTTLFNIIFKECVRLMWGKCGGIVILVQLFYAT